MLSSHLNICLYLTPLSCPLFFLIFQSKYLPISYFFILSTLLSSHLYFCLHLTFLLCPFSYVISPSKSASSSFWCPSTILPSMVFSILLSFLVFSNKLVHFLNSSFSEMSRCTYGCSNTFVFALCILRDIWATFLKIYISTAFILSTTCLLVVQLSAPWSSTE